MNNLPNNLADIRYFHNKPKLALNVQVEELCYVTLIITRYSQSGSEGLELHLRELVEANCV